MFRFYNICGLRTRVFEVGLGDPIVLLHGWGTNIESFSPIYSDLQNKRKIIALDFPGFGQTDFPPTPWGVGDYTDWLLALLQCLKIENADFLGHSFGGRVGIKLAVTHPKVVNKLILVDSAGVRQFKMGWRNNILKEIANIGKPILYSLPNQMGLKLRWKFYKAIGATDYLTAGRLKETYQKVINEDLEPVLCNISSPTLLIWGEEDRATPLKDGILMSKIIPDSKLVVIKYAGHYPFVDNSSEVNKQIENFLFT